ncbi:MAG: transglutaminase-like domain-containing protein, partial [Dehalococcoidales bacterium]
SGDAETVTYSVENRLKTDVVLTLGDFVSASLPVEVIAFGSDGDINGPAVDAEEETAAASNGEAATEPVPVAAGDVIAIVTPRLMKPYQRYTATALVSLPTAEELSLAGDDYPQEILDRYLQLPSGLPWRVLRMADDLTWDAETAYDKVLAIKEHVLGLTYNLEAEPTPEDTDAVDYFLFESREGVCTEFASALAVMLRTVGIPTRFTTGYLEGELDEKTGSYVLRIRDYHARTEVYFPDYGWVEFSATPVGENVGAVVGAATDDTFGTMDAELLGMEENLFGPDFDLFTQSANAARRSLPGPQLYVYFVVIGIPVVLVLAIRSGYALWLRGLKRVDSPAEVYDRMCRLASWGKAGPMAQETPLEYCGRLALALPLQAASIDTIAEAYIETRFSTRRELGRLQKGRLQKAWVRLVPDLMKGLPRLWRESA